MNRLSATPSHQWGIKRQREMNEALLVSLVRQHESTERAEKAEAALCESEARLEIQVALRTAELLAINEQLQGFSYSVAHDLRQQIRGISANASILMSDAADRLDDENMRTLNRLVNSSKRLAKLVDDLLTYARLGREEPHKLPFDFTVLAEEVAAFLIDNGRCRMGTRFEIAPGLLARGDALLIRVVVENLLDNACKYSAETERSIIQVGRDGEAFFVRDNGIGFDMKFVNRLFQPFERLHPNSVYSGTGIGLANVRRIVEKHGGTVRAIAEPGLGATFYFTLA